MVEAQPSPLAASDQDHAQFTGLQCFEPTLPSLVHALGGSIGQTDRRRRERAVGQFGPSFLRLPPLPQPCDQFEVDALDLCCE